MPSRNGQGLLRETVTVQDLASMFLVSERQIYRLTVQGVLRLARNKKRQSVRGRYTLQDAVSRYVEHLRLLLATRNGAAEEDYTAARAQRMAALAQQEAMRVQEMRDELLRKEDVEFCVTSMLTRFRQRLLASPSRLMHSLVGIVDPKVINLKTTEEIHGALNELATPDEKWLRRMRKKSEAFLQRQIEQEEEGQTGDP